jgi:hypothetical protein
MTFLVLYTSDKDTNVVKVISVHVGQDSLIRSAKTYIMQKHKILNDIPIVSCHEEAPSEEYYLIIHQNKCSCNNQNILELYRKSTVPGWVYGTIVQSELIDMCKWQQSIY